MGQTYRNNPGGAKPFTRDYRVFQFWPGEGINREVAKPRRQAAKAGPVNASVQRWMVKYRVEDVLAAMVGFYFGSRS